MTLRLKVIIAPIILTPLHRIKPSLLGFYVSVMSLDEARGEDMVDGGALLLLFVLNPNECKPDLSNTFSGWLREEADLRYDAPCFKYK